MAAKFTELIVDANDVERLAAFWQAVLGWERRDTYDEDGDVELAAPDGSLPTLVFVAVPEPKTVKGRLHIDVSPSGGADQDTELERLLSLGALPVDVGQGDDVSWVVLADPDGNEFCLLQGEVE
jgi:predicted enzyme related to lactoylglutathione lyase